jgi:hypothetical protein
MAITSLTATLMTEALTALDHHLTRPVGLIVGGGGAMILAHHFPLATSDIDAVPRGISFDELDPLVKTVAKELNIPPDWMNPYFSTFAHTLPADYEKRLITVFQGKHLTAQALGKEDMLIMKCFAHRQKDVGHAKALIKRGADIAFVEKRIEELDGKRIPGCKEALDFLDEVQD